MSANWLDRAIGYFSPARGLYRALARERLARAYEAASPRDKWRPRRPGASGNADFLADGAVLRTKARALVQNVPYIHAAINALVAHTVGTGITPTPLGPQKDVISTLWKAWVPLADADGQLDFYGLQAQAYRTMEVDGEVLVRLRARRPSDGLPIPLQIQLLEIDWLDTLRQQGAAEGNTIVNGIEYDQLGRVVAYWLFTVHPGDINLNKVNARGGFGLSKRVPADGIIHLKRAHAMRPGQGRGITRLAPVIPRVRDLQVLEDAELARKNLETRLAVIASGDVSKMGNVDQGGDRVTSDQAKATGELGQLPTGGIVQLPQGMDLTVVAPNPAPGHVDHVKHHLHIILTAMGVPYEWGTGDMTEVNFSSARVRINDARRQIETEQWLNFVPNFCGAIYRAAILAAAEAGKLRSADYAVDWSVPKWDYVNVQQEVQSDIDEISMGLSTISEKLRRRNLDPETVFNELETDFKRLETAGVLPILLQLLGRAGSAPKQPEAAAATKTKKAA